MNNNRREILQKGLVASAVLFSIPARALTPKQPEGPFYPVVDQVDTDADLVYLKGSNRAASGTVIIVQGHLTDQRNAPVSGALVEIWQACKTGRYNHPSDPNTQPLDPNFQYWGKAVTDANGLYRFRTIVPGAYPADTDWIRPPHIHFKVSKLGYLELITQVYFAGHELNAQDKYLIRLSEEEKRQLIIPFKNEVGMPHPVGDFNIQIRKL